MIERTGLLAVAVALLLLAGIVFFKPKTPLPPYALAVRAQGSGYTLTAAPTGEVEGELQAEAFWVDGTGVHEIRTPCKIDQATASIEIPESVFARATGAKIRLGLVIGRAYSMPSAAEAWEDLEQEGAPRPAFRVLSEEVVLTTTRARSADTDRSGRPSP